jgi:GNAT superfamily N-acetyltransferase
VARGAPYGGDGDELTDHLRVAELPPEFEISTDVTRLDIALIHDFLSTSYWAHGRKRAVVERAIRNSLCFGVYRHTHQVAFARVVTDRAVFAYLMDVFVLPEYRGRGISKALMRTILDHPDLQNLRMFLLATRDAHGLYAQFGFRSLEGADRFMAIQDPDSDSRAQ